jgi:hypothetical protein
MWMLLLESFASHMNQKEEESNYAPNGSCGELRTLAGVDPMNGGLNGDANNKENGVVGAIETYKKSDHGKRNTSDGFNFWLEYLRKLGW